jgi:hypothetical protein
LLLREDVSDKPEKKQYWPICLTPLENLNLKFSGHLTFGAELLNTKPLGRAIQPVEKPVICLTVSPQIRLFSMLEYTA